jgi:predicted nucleotidyltransferase
MSFIRQPLDLVLAGTGSVRVLRTLLGHGGALSVSRLARDTMMTPDGVRGVLSDLGRLRVVESLGSGRTRLFRAALAHPVIRALEALFEAERTRFDDIKNAITGAVGDERILAAWLFGSVARGEDTPDSDIDVALVVDGDSATRDAVADEVREAMGGIDSRLGITTSIVAATPDDVLRHANEPSTLWGDLLRDGQVLKGPLPDRLAATFAARAVAPADSAP